MRHGYTCFCPDCAEFKELEGAIMPIQSAFKTCLHRPEEASSQIDWRECYACIDEVTTQLMIARSYLKELAEGVFNEDGDMRIPVAEPIRGQHFQRIAATALSVIT